MERIVKALVLLLSVLMFPAQVKALTVQEIVDKANIAAYYQGNDGRSKINMSVISKGSERKKEFVVMRLNKEKGGEQKFYVYYQKPDDIRDTVYMVWKKINADDDRWLYLPGLNLVTRVAASDRRSKFAGSDYVYEDISGRSVNDDTHELVGEDGAYYTLKCTPKNPSSVEFAYYIAKIDKNNFLPKLIEYYNSNGGLMRTVETLTVEDIQGYPTVTSAVAKDLEAASESRLKFSDIKYDIGLTEDIFTERYLQKPPRKWLD